MKNSWRTNLLRVSGWLPRPWPCPLGRACGDTARVRRSRPRSPPRRRTPGSYRCSQTPRSRGTRMSCRRSSSGHPHHRRSGSPTLLSGQKNNNNWIYSPTFDHLKLQNCRIYARRCQATYIYFGYWYLCELFDEYCVWKAALWLQWLNQDLLAIGEASDAFFNVTLSWQLECVLRDRNSLKITTTNKEICRLPFKELLEYSTIVP